MASTAFKYNYAIVCRVPKSFADRGVSSDGRMIDFEEARNEHRQFVEMLRKCSVNIIELQEDEDYKDCCCVEDCAVVIGNTALITRPGLKTRQGEVISKKMLMTQSVSRHSHLPCRYCFLYLLFLLFETYKKQQPINNHN